MLTLLDKRGVNPIMQKRGKSLSSEPNKISLRDYQKIGGMR